MFIQLYKLAVIFPYSGCKRQKTKNKKQQQKKKKTNKQTKQKQNPQW